jgi:hypothetical protein
MLGLSTIRHSDTNSRPSAEPIEYFLVRMIGGLFKNFSKSKK